MGGLLTRLVRSARGVTAALRTPPYTAPGHYYSPATSPADRERAVAWRGLEPVGIDLRVDEQEKLAAELGPLMLDLPEDRWRPENGMYGRADAAVLHAMLRNHRPASGDHRTIIEVGSGFSTAVILDTVEHHMPGEVDLTCIDPSPARLAPLVRARDTLMFTRKQVQDVDVGEFARLRAGDMLIIDSTHVAKAGSDVIWLYLHVLPTLAPGVVVHVHDIHWPFEYPERWLRDGRDWTETYLLRAFLTHNTSWEILLMTSWLWTQRPELVPEPLRGQPTGALWMRRA